jgi:transposase
MRPYGTAKQLAQRRRRARALLRQGQAPAQVAKRLGTTTRSLRRWRREFRRPKRLSAQRVPGRPSCLSASQLCCLEQALQCGACADGYAEDYWTLERIGRLIQERFRVRYHVSSVWHLLQRLGWSCQRPQRRTFARDDKAIAHWKHYVWPQIKKVASTGGELGFCR